MKPKHDSHRNRKHLLLLFMAPALLLLMAVGVRAQVVIDEPPPPAPPLQLPAPTPNCERIVKADVVALDQVIMYNRLGTVNPAGMIFALKRDVVAIDPAKGIVAGNVRLRPDKRPRPLVLRMNNGD